MGVFPILYWCWLVRGFCNLVSLWLPVWGVVPLLVFPFHGPVALPVCLPIRGPVVLLVYFPGHGHESVPSVCHGSERWVVLCQALVKVLVCFQSQQVVLRDTLWLLTLP